MDFVNGFRSGDWLNKAKGYLNNPVRVKELLVNVLQYANKEGLDGVKEQLMLLYHYLADVFGGKYPGYDKAKIILIIGALIYLVTPTDLVPDFIPIAGLLDDTAVIGWVFSEVKSELDKYKSSRS